MIDKRHRARDTILGFCFFIAALLLPFKSYSQTTSGGGFRVYPADNIYADSAYYYLGYYHDILTGILDFSFDTLVTLHIADSDADFLRQTGSSFPDWGAGVALLHKSSMVIKSPKYIRVGKSFRELIGHELTHIMLHRASGGRWLPRWIHEGLAMRVSGEWNIGQDVLVARAVWTKNLIPLQRLEGLSAFNGALANLAYTESYLAVSSLLGKDDQYLLADLLEIYRETGDFHRSFRAVVGQDYISWIGNWYERTSTRYHLLLFIFDSRIFWIILPILIVLIFMLKKRQNLKTRKRWRREERFNPPDDSYKQYYDGYYDDENQV